MKVAGCRAALYPLCRPTELITLGSAYSDTAVVTTSCSISRVSTWSRELQQIE